MRNNKLLAGVLFVSLLASSMAGDFNLDQLDSKQTLGQFQAQTVNASAAVLLPIAEPTASRTPTGIYFRTSRLLQGPIRSEGNGISYHGGPVMIGTKHIYYIWYGDWSGNTNAIQDLQYLASNLGGSSYFNINTTYHDGQGRNVKNAITFGGSIFDHYSRGHALRDGGTAGIWDSAAIVQTALSRGLPADPMGVYFVITSSDVPEIDQNQLACTSFCGWHNHVLINGVDIKYAFIPDCDACGLNGPHSNFDDGSIDGMACVIAHELAEAATDPDLDAWYRSDGQENADLCLWDFGNTQPISDTTIYNTTFGKDKFLLQQNWVNASGGYCALNYP